MTNPPKPPAEMTCDELAAEIERTRGYLDELQNRLLLCIEQKEKELRGELDALLQKKRELGAAAKPAESCRADAGRIRRTKERVAEDAKRIYEVIAQGRGVTRADIAAALPDITLPADIKQTLVRHGFKVKATGSRRDRRYLAPQ